MRLIVEKEKMTRDEVQNKALSLYKENPFVALLYATGLGKSFASLKILNYVMGKNKKAKCLFLEPETALISNIKREFEKFNLKHLLEATTVICYHSLHKVKEKYDIIVLDEAHRGLSDLRQHYLGLQNPKSVVLLSATLSNSQIREFEKLFECEFTGHKVELKKAIEWGILPKPKIGIFNLKLNDKDINCSYQFCRGTKSKRVKKEVFREEEKWGYLRDKAKFPHLELTIHCTEQQKYNQLCYEADYARKKYFEKLNSGVTNKTLEYANNRYLYSELCIKRYLSEIKTPYLDKFLKSVQKHRFIAFFGSVAQAVELAKKHKGTAIYSGEKRSNEFIDMFNRKEISNLYCVGKLQEGANLTDIEVAIIGQLDAGQRAFIQKFGRGLRAEEPEIYIFFFEDTKDEKYLEKALENIEIEHTRKLKM